MSEATQALPRHVEKAVSGIRGLDEITEGGLPRGRATLVCGGPGCGKTLLAAEFLVRGAQELGEPGVFMSFEETAADLTANLGSLGLDLPKLIREKKLYVDYVRVERSEIEEAGDYDLEGLFVRLENAARKVNAKRVVLDTVESLFSGFGNEAILRAELRRLFHWLKEHNLTAVVTGERGATTLTRYGLEEYISDCVIVLDHRVEEQVSTRRLRIVKYRGSLHGTNEYPFLIDEDGITVVPITSAGLTHGVSSARVSTGVPGLDEMFGGEGLFRGSTVLYSGTAGTGKTTLCGHMSQAACERGERVLYFAFEESPAQIVRNMAAAGIRLQPHVDSGQLRFCAGRATLLGLEAHLARMARELQSFNPDVVVIDPLTALTASAPSQDVRALATRLIDLLKMRGITAVMTSLTTMGPATALESTDVGVSSLMDAWVLLRDIEYGGERNRGVYILKCRGMAHSNQIREYLITGEGIKLLPPYLGPEGVLTGSARVAQEARARAAEAEHTLELDRTRRRTEQRRAAIQAQIAALHADLQAEEMELERAQTADLERQSRHRDEAGEIARRRHAQAAGAGSDGPGERDVPRR